MEIKKIMVAGAGLMGLGIAEVAARAGFTVSIYEVDAELADSALGRIGASLDRQVKKERIGAGGKEEALSALSVGQLADAGDAELVIEAISENFERKAGLYRELDAVCGPERSQPSRQQDHGAALPETTQGIVDNGTGLVIDLVGRFLQYKQRWVSQGDPRQRDSINLTGVETPSALADDRRESLG